jgi:HK97 family phage major capsid protein
MVNGAWVSQPVRQVASVVQVSTSDDDEVVRTDSFATGWVGETDARTATNTPTFAEVPAVMGKIYANPHAAQQILDDSAYNIEGPLADQIARDFAVQGNVAFTTGNGVRAFGTIQYVPTGQAGAWPTDCAR